MHYIRETNYNETENMEAENVMTSASHPFITHPMTVKNGNDNCQKHNYW